MAQRNSNVLAIITWVVGLLGCAGYLNPFGFFPVLLPILFWLFGNNFTKDHCRIYFNVLLTAFIIHVLGVVIERVFRFIHIHTYHFEYLALIYFAVFCIIGLFKALNHKKYRPTLIVQAF